MGQNEPLNLPQNRSFSVLTISCSPPAYPPKPLLVSLTIRPTSLHAKAPPLVLRPALTGKKPSPASTTVGMARTPRATPCSSTCLDAPQAGVSLPVIHRLSCSSINPRHTGVR
jgi:hypothetical protein